MTAQRPDSANATFASPWPAEDGGPARLQTPRAQVSLGLTSGGRLRASRRRVFLGTMTVLREPGEVYLLTHSMLRHRVLGLPTHARVEKIDPLGLHALARSPALAGGPAWPGGLAVHRNGDLYVVYGRWCHRLSPALELRGSRELPRNRPYNSFVILSDGTLVTKDLSERGDSALVCIDPETLEILGEPLAMPEPSIARLSAAGDTLYVIGVRSAFRYAWDRERKRLALDPVWRFEYLCSPEQTYGWDPVVDGANVWFMDNGKHRYARRMTGAGVGPGAVHLIRVSMHDVRDHQLTAICGRQRGSITNPPLVDVTRQIVVAYDSANAHLRAWRFDAARRSLDPLWERADFGCASHLLLLPESGDLLANDHQGWSESLVLLDIATGAERGRVRTGGRAQGVVFPSVGWNRDLYHVSFDALTRLWWE